MPNKLTSKQCDLLQERYPGLGIWKTTYSSDPWLAVRSTDREHGIYGSSRQDALTKWCKKWSPDWTPPVVDTEPRSDIHDVEDTDEGSKPTREETAVELLKRVGDHVQVESDLRSDINIFLKGEGTDDEGESDHD